MRPRFEVLEHTADVGIRACGASLPELFENAAFGAQFLALDPSAVVPAQAYTLSAAGEDLEELMINWLNEIIFQFDGRRLALARIRVEQMEDTAITAQAWGEPRDPERHPNRLVVKAATWHQFKIEKRDEDWIADVYFDV